MNYSLAIDIGGTFTDAVLRRDDGMLTVDKTLTTHHDLLEGFFRGVGLVMGKAGATPDQVTGVVVHATTVVTNALIERKGAATALIVTKGFRDVLSIRNEHRYEMFDPQIEFADPLVPRELTFEVDERVLADGERLRAVDEDEIVELARQIKASGVASVAICFLNSFRNAANEQEVAAILAKALPGVSLSLSSAVAPQIREYPRTSTTVVNAYTAPITEPYLQGLATGLEARAIGHRPLIMLSSGGIIGAEIASRNPVRMIESGPAAGALAAAHFAKELGLDRLLAFDMGGTTAKACLIENHEPLVTGSFEVDRIYRFMEGSGMPLTIPSVDMIEIGAGGGSIASIDELGLLKVGPRSAGSMPGPACYGRGGTKPTVTDSDLVLGLLDGANFLGGDMALDIEAARTAIAIVGDELGTSVTQTAAGIFRIVAETMAAAAREHATDRGFDYRGLPLLAFGGAGPVHACAVGELLQSAAVIFPPQASVLSAFGTLVTPVRLDLVRSALGRLEGLDWAEVDTILGELTQEGTDALESAGVAGDAIRLRFGADLRYVGQQNEVAIEIIDDPRIARDASILHAGFEAAYFAQYGVNPSHVPVELVSWRVTAEGPKPVFNGVAGPPMVHGAAKTRRRVGLWEEAGDVPVYDRAVLGGGQMVAGPAIVEERETTIVIPPNWSARVDDLGCLIATRSA
ncbi:hydantoinase/oxoprolinase family protein [Rhizorhabdus sp.]|jgi:N-methylhydantoinase A|uniref:hydantoinase/oxoprolinase family protein n=1 Tax=Rhizorhabdus sp. TaxID=1968843 RepID=UPI0019AD7EC6|nr:hydantoinase/oxoprolinase family protein [Rhizorhabdus sp.]MBD3760412.1 hydantoinase/oxoprolinase family protein [Rhizorhabdus sp.]